MVAQWDHMSTAVVELAQHDNGALRSVGAAINWLVQQETLIVLCLAQHAVKDHAITNSTVVKRSATHCGTQM